MEAIVVATISAISAIAVALINARASRRRPAAPTSDPAGAELANQNEQVETPRPGRIRRASSRLWGLLTLLPQLGRRRSAWIAALVGFVFGGFGIALYFRRQADVLVGLAFLLPLYFATRGDEGADTSVSPWFWPFATLAATYFVLRVESANRRLEREDAAGG